jgi:hypothetical protein
MGYVYVERVNLLVMMWRHWGIVLDDPDDLFRCSVTGIVVCMVFS